tara:strand:- start:3074 stop:3292 length:219 start_codon:yes stop_codon:yes gene_type:complete
MQTGKKDNMILKKDIWIDEDGKVAEANDGLPKGWAKGKLVAKAGTEISDLQAKELGLKKETKAKKAQENKSK